MGVVGRVNGLTHSGHIPLPAKLTPEQLRIAGLVATGLRDAAIDERLGLGYEQIKAVQTAVTRLYPVFGANRDLDRYYPRIVLALQYWRMVGKLREEDELCCCPHIHTGNGNGAH